MTRRRLLLALLVLTAVVAATMPVLMRPRGTGVQIKFAGFGTNGAVLMRFENNSGRRLAVGRLITFEPDGKRAFHPPIPNQPVSPAAALTWMAVRNGEKMVYQISPAPPKTPWHAQVEYLDVGGLGVKVRHLLVQARLLQSKPLVLRNATSEVITNAPPVP
jgi:hypothetical protein